MASILPTGSSSVAMRVRPRQERAWSIVGSVIASSSAAFHWSILGAGGRAGETQTSEPRLPPEAATTPSVPVVGVTPLWPASCSGEPGPAPARHGGLDVAGEPAGPGGVGGGRGNADAG